MPRIVLEPTSTAQWHALVSEAEAACECRLGEELESYLVFLLMRFAARPDLASRVMALEFLRSMRAQGALQAEQLRDVGDQCLLYSGLYPERAERRLVRVGYYVDMGRSAYGLLAERLRHAAAEVYARLSEGFVSLRDVLSAMREMDPQAALDPLAQAEIWLETGSEHARRRLAEVTGSEPMPLDAPPRRRH